MNRVVVRTMPASARLEPSDAGSQPGGRLAQAASRNTATTLGPRGVVSPAPQEKK